MSPLDVPVLIVSDAEVAQERATLGQLICKRYHIVGDLDAVLPQLLQEELVPECELVQKYLSFPVSERHHA